MKKINKILNSLTLLSPLAGIGFNNSVQKVITENCFSFNNYANSNAEPVKMGEIWVTVDESDPTIITGYSSGEGTLEVASNITKISNNAFNGRTQISSIDFSKATSLTTIGDGAFDSAGKESSEIFIPEKLSSIGFGAFNSWIFQSIEVAEGNQHFSLATNLGPNNKILVIIQIVYELMIQRFFRD